MQQIDLHVHSTCSDGTCSPSELVDHAMEKGLSAFALTDHDTISGLEEALNHADSLRRTFLQAGDTAGAASVPEVIPGVELSTEYNGADVHIVGLFIDFQDSAFADQLQKFVDSRTERNHKMCRLLQEAGIHVTYEALLEEFPDSVITRAHYAKYMLNHGYISSVSEAFDRYIGDQCPCFVPREKVTPTQAIRLILSAKGLPVLAHPILYHLGKAQLDQLTSELKDEGLMGIEAIYSNYKPSDERQIRALAAKYDLLISGGSDFHGDTKPGLDLGCGYGELFVPMDILTDLKAALNR